MHIYPWQIDPNPLLLQSSIDVCKTITQHTFHIYSTMHIYPWQIDPTPSSKLA